MNYWLNFQTKKYVSSIAQLVHDTSQPRIMLVDLTLPMQMERLEGNS